ncbi:transporter substrate-binding domain-containing protein [Massilia sp. W12]|uniref:transporter substrate-binding domain-containing protein n=1 Tax=Massilia sp. W12 TaxID=3126507 RepID=UPI0030D04AFD
MKSALCLLFAVACGPVCAEAVLRVGGFLVAPMMMGEGDQALYGALPEFLQNEVAPKAGVKLIFLPVMSFPRAKQALKEGSLDVLLISGNSTHSGMQRASWAWLAPRSFLAVTPASPWRKVTSLQELSGKRIGWVGGSQLPPEFKDIAVDWDFSFSPTWQSVNLKKLQLGRLDAVFFQNPYSAIWWGRKDGMPLRLLDLPLPAEKFAFGYAQRADAAAVARFDQAAAAAFAGDKFKRWLESYAAQR